MKKLLFILLSIVPLTFTCCSSSDDGNEGGNSSKIIGVWTETDYWDDGAFSGNPNTWHTWGFVTRPVHEFKSDKTYNKYGSLDDYKNGKAKSTGTYTFDGQNLAINGGYKRKVTFTESGNGFEWERTAICVRNK